MPGIPSCSIFFWSSILTVDRVVFSSVRQSENLSIRISELSHLHGTMWRHLAFCVMFGVWCGASGGSFLHVCFLPVLCMCWGVNDIFCHLGRFVFFSNGFLYLNAVSFFLIRACLLFHLLFLYSHGSQLVNLLWTFSLLFLKNSLLPLFWEHTVFIHCSSIVSTFFLSSLIYSLIYLMTIPGLLVAFSLYLVVWWNLSSSQGGAHECSSCMFSTAFSSLQGLEDGLAGHWIPGSCLLKKFLWKYYFTVYGSVEKSTCHPYLPC